MTPREFIQSQNIFGCNACQDIIHLQAEQNINVIPLFWQGNGREHIPLVIMGGNPSVVGTLNEPRRGECNFDDYFDYYQNRAESETINEEQALVHNSGREREDRITIPKKYWTMCHKLAKKIVGEDVQRWEDYVLMEAIHCFYNREDDLNVAQQNNVARACFNKHTRNMLLFLKPRMIVLLGELPYKQLKQLVDLEELEGNRFFMIRIEGELNGTNNVLHIPVLRHRHPGFYGPFYSGNEVYEEFRKFAGFNR
jgi:hypothetical protein